MQKFTNNSVAAFGEAYGSSDTSFYISVWAASFKAVNHPYMLGESQFATLTSASDPTKIEIVKIVNLKPNESFLKVERGQDGTTAQSWSAGDKLSGRINAGMLKGFVQNELGDLTLPPKNVSLTGCFNPSKENVNDEDSKSAAHARI